MSKDQNFTPKEAEDTTKEQLVLDNGKYAKVQLGVYTMYIERSSDLVKQFLPSSRLIKRILTSNLSESWFKTDDSPPTKGKHFYFIAFPCREVLIYSFGIITFRNRR